LCEGLVLLTICIPHSGIGKILKYGNIQESGIYLYKMSIDGVGKEVKKVILLR